jgi:hypothetical protein
MGYSLTAKADFTLKAAMKIIGDKEQSNVFRGYFYERGKENIDGAFTAQVFKMNGKYCKRSGSIRIDANGFIIRFPTMTKEEKQKAQEQALTDYLNIYGENRFK